ncbi:MAG: DUF4214 domain-containing protein [Desulfobacteraceae bacterium]|nr:DUF4214 domain-containing protein [Desulfobacteraceae bacterium]
MLFFSRLGTAGADFEPNNSVSQAREITAGFYHISGTGEDWYRIQANPGMMQLVMTPRSGTDVNMVLHNSKLQVVAGNFLVDEESIAYEVSASDTYYLKIYSPGSTRSDYTLSIELPRGSWSKVLDFGPVRDVSVALFDIDNDGKDEIFIGTSKGLDGNLNEIRPAGLICLEDTGEIKWTKSFPAIDGPDPQTGIVYRTTSVSTAPVFSDITGDGRMNIIVGVGGDSFGETGLNIVGQPGDKGGVYALDDNGEIIWFNQSLDTIGGDLNNGEGRPDGVYGTPLVFDIDQDNVKEVIYGGWDQSLWILDGPTGGTEVRVHLADTIWSSPCVADVNNDGLFEVLISADISANTDAQTSTGGIFHIISADGTQNIPGFDQPVGNPGYTDLRGKAEEQVLWSSPTAADLDQDGTLEIIYGTGNYIQQKPIGEYIRVWEHNGEPKFKLLTQGRTFAAPLVTDIDNDGDLEILAVTLEGYLYCWDHQGYQLFATQVQTFPGKSGQPIFCKTIAVDLDGDHKLEIILSQGSQMIVLDSRGVQLTSPHDMEYIFELFKGSPAVKDIDGDLQVDLISGGNTSAKDQAMVFRWNSPLEHTGNSIVYGAYQSRQSLHNIRDFVGRFYKTVLGRTADAAGLNDWVDRLNTGVNAGADVARGFIFSQECVNLNLSDPDYLNVLYTAFFNRRPDSGGYALWEENLKNGMDREEVLEGFIYSEEFFNLSRSYSILPVK